METMHTFLKITIPKYLKSLPIPKNLEGYTKLSGEQWMALIPFYLILGIFFYALLKAFIFGRKRKQLKPKVNQSVQKEDSKVVTQMDIEDIGDKIAFCRCWRSKKFPLCDGSHNAHNAETRDNVGPLLLRRAEDEK